MNIPNETLDKLIRAAETTIKEAAEKAPQHVPWLGLCNVLQAYQELRTLRSRPH